MKKDFETLIRVTITSYRIILKGFKSQRTNELFCNNQAIPIFIYIKSLWLISQPCGQPKFAILTHANTYHKLVTLP